NSAPRRRKARRSSRLPPCLGRVGSRGDVGGMRSVGRASHRHSPPTTAPVPATSPPPAAQPPPAAPAQSVAPAVPPPAPPSPAVVPLSSTETAVLVSRGDDFLKAGDVASARLYYERAADAGNGSAALRMGATFDPGFLASAGVRGTLGDPARAAS